MGHRKHSQPRRGSMAYYPRVRAKTMKARIRGWPSINSKEPKLLACVGFKVGCVQIVSIDDREHVPNHGKQLVSLGTVLAIPPIFVLGMRGYSKDAYGTHAKFDVFAKDIPKDIAKSSAKHHITLKNKNYEKLQELKDSLNNITEMYAILAVSPRTVGLEQKKPYIFEALVSGGSSIQDQFDYVKELLGKDIKISELFELGSNVDVASITKGKGWQGVIQRMGAKRKQHKSRKTVRELGSLGPISPQNVMYTVPRAGQMGFHQRVEYNKRIMVIGDKDDNSEKDKKETTVINPKGGFKHFGVLKSDYIILRGSVPGTYKRMVKLRSPIRNIPTKILKPNILEIIV